VFRIKLCKESCNSGAENYIARIVLRGALSFLLLSDFEDPGEPGDSAPPCLDFRLFFYMLKENIDLCSEICNLFQTTLCLNLKIL